MDYRFIADSAADLPDSIIEKYDIDVFPLYVHHGDHAFKDRIEISPEELYKNMKKEKVYKTSQVTVNDFLVKFEEYAKKKETVIYLAFSSELSGTFQSAVLAKEQIKEEYPQFDLTIIDSRCASMGVGLAIYNTIDDIENQIIDRKNKDEVVKRVCYYAEHMEHIFTVDDLDYLVRGGRLNKVSGFVGGILNIKPIISIEDGVLKPREKKKGRKRVLKRIIEIMEERGTNLKEQKVAIIHADAKKDAKKLEKMIDKRFNPESIIVHTIGAVIGAHAGPGALGVFFINDNREKNKVKIK
ncbi:MAG: DegV family protein [Halanaerobiales bacterium]